MKMISLSLNCLKRRCFSRVVTLEAVVSAIDLYSHCTVMFPCNTTQQQHKRHLPLQSDSLISRCLVCLHASVCVASSWRTVVIMSTKDLRIYFHATLQRSTRRMPKSPLCVRIYEVVYMVAVLTLRPYAPLILLLRCQSNFLAIRTECAELWNRCVCMLQATSWGALAD